MQLVVVAAVPFRGLEDVVPSRLSKQHRLRRPLFFVRDRCADKKEHMKQHRKPTAMAT